MNKVILIGNLANDPEGRTTQSGISQSTFRIAVQRRFANAQGVREADFLTIVAWRTTADFCNRYLCKGRKIAVEGSADEDDYGRVVAPDYFKFKITPNYPDGRFYGYSGWTENYTRLLAEHPLYVDPLDAFVGRGFFFLIRLRGIGWNPESGSALKFCNNQRWLKNRKIQKRVSL